MATWQHDAGHQDPGRRRRRADVHRGTPAAGAGAGRRRPSTTATAPSLSGGAQAAADDDRPVEARLAVLQGPELVDVLTRHPLRELVTVEGPYPLYADRNRALFGSLVRVLPALRGRDPRREDRQGHHRHLPHRRRAPGRGRRDGLRRHLPAADPPHRRGQPQGPEQHPDPRPRGHRLAVGDRQQGRRPRRDPPRARHLRRLRRVRRPGRRAGPRGRARPRAAGGARPPVGDQPPAVLHHARRRHHRLRGEPAEEVPGHLPDELRQRPERHLPRGAAGRAALDVPRRADLPRRQPAHQAARVLGVAARRRSGAPIPTCSSCPRPSPARR